MGRLGPTEWRRAAEGSGETPEGTDHGRQRKAGWRGKGGGQGGDRRQTAADQIGTFPSCHFQTGFVRFTPPSVRLYAFTPSTPPKVFFVLNGHPHRVYRALINPLRKGYLDHQQLLEEVSQGLQAAIFRLYSFDGDRILEIEQFSTFCSSPLCPALFRFPDNPPLIHSFFFLLSYFPHSSPSDFSS